MAKECSSTDKLPQGDLLSHSVIRIIDCPDMTSTVYRGCKATNQTNRTKVSAKIQATTYSLCSLFSDEFLLCENAC